MKRLKKFIAGAMTLAMAMSMLTMTVSAEEGSNAGEVTIFVDTNPAPYSDNGASTIVTEQENPGEITIYMNSVPDPRTVTSQSTITSKVIDPNMKGSITIHKYVFEDYYNHEPGVEKPVPDLNPNGQEITGPVPGGSAPLKGATFELYQVENYDFLKDLYSSDGKKTPVPGDYLTMKNLGYDPVTGPINKWVIKDTCRRIGEKVTGEDGIAEFSNLDVGLYLVWETEAPDSVVNKVVGMGNPFFLVSVPMTTDGSEWLYDVHVYPKNQLSLFVDLIPLRKYGENRVPLEGVTYALQKQIETKNADGTSATAWIPIMKDAKNGNDNEGDPLVLTTDKDGWIAVSNLSRGKYRLIERDLGSNHGYILDSAAVYEFEVNAGDRVTVTAPIMYADSGCSIVIDPFYSEHVYEPGEFYNETISYNGSNWASPDPETFHMIAVNEKPDITKEVRNSAGDWGKMAEYGFDDTIPYEVTVNVPSKIMKMDTFTVTDVPTGLHVVTGQNDDFSGIVLKAAGAPGENGGGSESGAVIPKTNGAGNPIYEITKVPPTDTNGTGFQIVFHGANMEAYAGREIKINYEAKLDPASANTKIGADMGNPNVVELEYSAYTTPLEDDPGAPTTPDTYVIQDKAVVYSSEITIEKLGEGEKLSGVKFDLYRQAKEGETRDAISSDEAKQLGLETKNKEGETITWIKLNQPGLFGTPAEGPDAGKLITGNGGLKVLKGLVSGTYYLVETETAADYNLLSKPVEVKLDVSYTLADPEPAVWTEYDRGDDRGKGWHLIKRSSFILDAANSTLKECKIQVQNKKGFTLPSTGGMGTFVFTFVGAAMMAAAVILFFTSRKKQQNT